MGLGAWKLATAKELAHLGKRLTGAALVTCGESAWVSECTCGEEYAAVEVRAQCDLRICPYCARMRAEQRARRLTDAALRVPDYTEARRAEVLAELDGAALDAAERVGHWVERAQAAEARAGAAGGTEALRLAELAARHRDRAQAAEKRRADARWQWHRVQDRQWGWKLVTISPAWKPRERAELEIDGLRRRVSVCWDAWARVWERLRCGGLASASVSIELSDGGHVHLHAMVYSPWVKNSYLAELAGCFVDVRALELNAADVDKLGLTAALRSAVKEAAKYTCKLPTPSRWEWVAGQHFRVLHPALAARWLLANAGRQLARLYGPLRDAWEAEPESEPLRGYTCRACGEPVAAPSRLVKSAELARVLGRNWGCLTIRRDTT